LDQEPEERLRLRGLAFGDDSLELVGDGREIGRRRRFGMISHYTDTVAFPA
jgi:hypothetical protein